MTQRKGLVLASHQPDFFPYMGYFYKMFQSDVFVFSDNVQFSKTGRHNDNEILTANGPLRFTLPVHYHVQNLNEIQIAADNVCVDKMLKTLWMEYKGADGFHDAFPVIEELFHTATTAKSLADFNRSCLLRFALEFGLYRRIKFVNSSNMPITQRRDARIIEMCGLLGAETYVSGSGAKDYHIEEDYVRAGINLVYSDYQPIKYPQVGRPATENLSVIDYVLNCGFNLPRGWKRYE